VEGGGDSESPELVSVFIEASRTLKSIVLKNNKDAKNLKTICVFTESTVLTFKAFKKMSHFVTLSF
jgi:hypothetical protein